ncbi:MAG: SlyX family protein [Steroidobacteraceae bacterium]
MTAALEQIETKIAYLEQANAELSAAMFRQQQELDALRMQLTDMSARVAASQAPATAWTAEQEKPPHF